VARASESSPAVVVEVSTPPRLPAVGEAEALAGVLRLLVDNACRQCDAGVTVKAKRGDEGITVHVIDRGRGMDREHAPEGFEAARTLIALHGGVLWAEPLPAGGTRVGFTIPEEPPAAEDFDAEAALEAIRLLERLAAPSPEAAPEPAPAVHMPPTAEEPPRRFVLDPLHPATQMLRGLALDYDPDADDARGRTIRPPRTT
jgi:hypothetical protein